MKNRKIRLGKIKYANVAPLYRAFDNRQMPQWLEIVEGSPATLNSLMMEGSLDVSPVSSVAYGANSDKWDLLPGPCISCHGRVMSVILALRGPLEDLDNAPLYLTNESATSVQLLKLILENEGLSPEYRPWKTEDAKELPWDAIGGLLIGDVALEWIYHQRSPMFIDLGEYWYTWTGQRFVFAVWAVRKDISKEFSRHISQLYNFFNLSVEDASFAMNSIAKRVAAQLNLPLKLVQRYFECLSYRFGVAEIEGMRRFFHLLNAKGVLESKVNIRFVET